MNNGYIITCIVVIFLVVLGCVKRNMVMRLFTINTANPTMFYKELEKTTNAILGRLENQMQHLEYLLEEADNKIKLLEEKLQKMEIVKAQVGAEICNESDYYTRDINPLINNKGYRIYEDIAKQTAASVEAELANITEYNENNQLSLRINNDKKSLILAMDEEGYTVTEIAKATALGKGEIMLVLQLSRK